MLRSSLWIVQTVVVFLCALAVGAVSEAAEPSAADIAQIEELEAWLNTILEEKLKDAAVVKVWTGVWDQFGSRKSKRVPRIAYGILLAETEETFRIFDLDSLQKRSFVKSENTKQPYQRVGYEAATVAQAKKAVLAHENGAFGPGAFGPDALISPASRTLIACLAHRAGQTDEAVRLIQGIPRPRGNNQQPATLKQLVGDDLSEAWMRWCVAGFADPKITYRELIQRCRLITRHLPFNEDAKRAKGIVSTLVNMIREDEAYRKQLNDRKQSGVQPTQEQRIADLIFQLRGQNGDQSCVISDQNGRRWFLDFYVARGDFFFDARGQDSPAHQLVKIGDPAIPQLIAALDDDRFTRTLDDEDTVLRVGDCAASIISHIAGRRFDHLSPNGGPMAKDGQGRRTKDAIQTWWDEYVKKGRRQMLIEGTARGDSESLYQLDRLIDEFPEASLQPLITGATNTNLTEVYSTYIRQLGTKKDERSLAFLNSEFEKQAGHRFRTMLAVQLMIRGEKNVVARMMTEWERLVNKSSEKKGQRLFGGNSLGGNSLGGGAFGGGAFGGNAFGGSPLGPGPFEGGRSSLNPAESMVGFLMATEDPATVNALAKQFSRLAVADRLSLLKTMVVSKRTIPKPLRYKSGESSEFDAAVERFLHRALNDTERRTGLRLSLGGYKFEDPRICDFAAYALAQRWPARYQYLRQSTAEQREAHRQKLLREWQPRELGRPAKTPR